MQNAKQENLISEAEYLEGELVSEVKHEYVSGKVFAMSGASMNHELICANLLRHTGNHLQNSSCVVVGSNMKVKTPAGNFRYPDAMVVCEQNSESQYYVTNPVILVEVLSQSTRRTDEQTKRVEYLNIPGLQEYVLIEQDFVDIEVVKREPNGWSTARYYLGDSISLTSIGLTISVEDIYYRVQNNDVVQFLAAKTQG